MKFNYLIGFYWESNPKSIGSYEYFGTIKYGTIEEATDYLNFIKSRNPVNANKYKLFKVIPLETE